MIRVLLDVAYQRVDGPKLMVIDDVSQWATLRRRGNPLRAADCGHGYVEAQHTFCGGNEVLVTGSPMDIFIDHLDFLFIPKLQRICNTDSWSSLWSSGFFVHILGRDNQVPVNHNSGTYPYRSSWRTPEILWCDSTSLSDKQHPSKVLWITCL
jgi:hypothetical protein